MNLSRRTPETDSNQQSGPRLNTIYSLEPLYRIFYSVVSGMGIGGISVGIFRIPDTLLPENIAKELFLSPTEKNIHFVANILITYIQTFISSGMARSPEDLVKASILTAIAGVITSISTLGAVALPSELAGVKLTNFEVVPTYLFLSMLLQALVVNYQRLQNKKRDS